MQNYLPNYQIMNRIKLQNFFKASLVGYLVKALVKADIFFCFKRNKIIFSKYFPSTSSWNKMLKKEKQS